MSLERGVLTGSSLVHRVIFLIQSMNICCHHRSKPSKCLSPPPSLPVGELGLSREGGHQPEPGGAQQPHVRGGPAADLHADAPGLLPPLPQLLRLQRAPGHQEAHLPGHLDRASAHSQPQPMPTRLLLPLNTSRTATVPEARVRNVLPLLWLT